MAKGLSLYIGAETKDAVRGLNNIGDGLEQLQDELGVTVKDSAKLERNFSDDMRDMAAASGKTGRGIGRDMKEGTREASDGVRNFKDEAKQNFAEVASSFDGTAQGIADGIQGTLGGASIAVGGLAGAALGALAVVGGAVGNAIATAVDEDAQASEERIQSMYNSFIESGLTYLTESQKIDAASALTGDPAKLAEFTQQAKDLGVSVKDVILAQVSAGEERNALQSKLNDQIGDYNKALEDGTYTDGTRLVLLEGYLSQYQTLNGEQSKSTQAAELQRSIAEEITGQQKLTTEEIQKANKALAETPKNLPVKIDVDSSAIDRALERRTLRIDIDGYTRNGQKVA